MTRRALNHNRDMVIEEAIRAGKFSEARRQLWSDTWDIAPQNTAAAIAMMAPTLAGVPRAPAAAAAAPLAHAVPGPTHDHLLNSQERQRVAQAKAGTHLPVRRAND